MIRKILNKVAGFFALGWLAATPSLAVNKGDLPALPLSELHKIDSVVGDGENAKRVLVTVHYTGWLYDPSKPQGKDEV
ncbi:MAG: hypothetical protein CM15mP58_15780 [Burkholderiaceae bacterium]|nr:MAG: hypothetical protein CM15mP58_15780 [Burkholderiaceae bacterium]